MSNLPWLACGILALAAFILKFCLPGYSFSALVCCIVLFVILFYTLVNLHWLRRAFTLCLCFVLGVVAVTEGIIFYHSFGSDLQGVDYAVVLGAKVRDTGPSVSMMDRVYAAESFLRENPGAVVVVSGGQGPDEPMTEAKAMFDALVSLGIGEDRIWQEDQATSTWENLNFSLDLIEEKTGKRPDRLGVISSEYHLFRACLQAEKCGVEFAGIPAKTSRMGQKINHFMREVAGVWHFLILGGSYD